MHTNELVSQLFKSINGRELAILDEILAEDAVFHFPKTAPLQGKRRIVTFFKVLFRKFPALTFTVGRVIANDSGAAAEWTNRGELKDGTAYENAGVTVIELKNEQIAYISDTFKDTELF